MPDESAIGLATFLEGLRSELKTSMDNAKRDRSLAFQLTKLDVELQVTAEMSADGSGKVKFWVVEVGAGAKGSNKSVQTIKMSLQPMADGRPIDPLILTPEIERPK